uniref:Uncharacterized protein n=1 Tax=Arundo donax TaxID=35708 RepID=A0A0A9F8G1_ARUDO
MVGSIDFTLKHSAGSSSGEKALDSHTPKHHALLKCFD